MSRRFIVDLPGTPPRRETHWDFSYPIVDYVVRHVPDCKHGLPDCLKCGTSWNDVGHTTRGGRGVVGQLYALRGGRVAQRARSSRRTDSRRRDRRATIR